MGRRVSYEPDPTTCARRSRSFYISMLGFWLLGELALFSSASPKRARTPARASSSIMACMRWSAGREASIASIRSEEHTSELQSLMRISYAVFCLKKKKNKKLNNISIQTIHQLRHENQ